MSQNLRKPTTLAEADPYWELDQRASSTQTNANFEPVVLVRVLRQCDARYAEALVTLLEPGTLTTISNPVVDRVARTGTYTSSVVTIRGDNDRSVTIVNKLTKLFTTATNDEGAAGAEILELDMGKIPRGLQRCWYYRDLTTKNALMGTAGFAMQSYPYSFPIAGPTWNAPTSPAVNDYISAGAITKLGATWYVCTTAHVYVSGTPIAAPENANWTTLVVSNYNATLYPVRVKVVNHGDGGYDVIQTLSEIVVSSDGTEGTYEREWMVVLEDTRTFDDKIKTIKYMAHEKACASQRKGRDYINSQVNTHTSNGPLDHSGHVLVKGSDHNVKTDRGVYMASVLTKLPGAGNFVGNMTDTTTGIRNWT